MWQFRRTTKRFLRLAGPYARPPQLAPTPIRLVSEFGEFSRQIAGDSAGIQRSEADRRNTYSAVQNHQLLQIRMLRCTIQQVRSDALASMEGHRGREIERRARIRHGTYPRR